MLLYFFPDGNLLPNSNEGQKTPFGKSVPELCRRAVGIIMRKRVCIHDSCAVFRFRHCIAPQMNLSVVVINVHHPDEGSIVCWGFFVCLFVFYQCMVVVEGKIVFITACNMIFSWRISKEQDKSDVSSDHKLIKLCLLS